VIDLRAQSNFRVSLTSALCPQSLDSFLEVCTRHYSDSYVALRDQSLNPEQGDEDDEDSDMEIGGMTVNLRCPLLQRYLEEPMTSYVL
jgi:hypothetical protein